VDISAMLSGNAMGAGFGFVLQGGQVLPQYSLQECILRKRFTLLRSYLVAFVIEWSARISLISTLAMSSVVSKLQLLSSAAGPRFICFS